MFNPAIAGLQGVGVHQVVNNTLKLCDLDIRRDFYANILLAGGNTMPPGFAERLQRELAALIPPAFKIRVVANDSRKQAAWVGGSVLASLSTSQSGFITKEEYEEYGPMLVSKRLFCL